MTTEIQTRLPSALFDWLQEGLPAGVEVINVGAGTDLALVEMRRVLCPGGPCIAVWNLRDHADPAMSAYEAILKEHAPEYESVGAEPAAEKLLAHPLAQLQEKRAFAHSQHFDRKGLHGRCWSSSYVRHSVKDPEALNQALDALFDKFAEQESFRFSYVTKAFSLSL